MSRLNLNDNRITHPRFWGSKSAGIRQILGAAYSVHSDGPNNLYLDANGATRIVMLPTHSEGLHFLISNVGTSGILDIQDSIGGAVVSLNAGISAWMISSGTTWVMIGGFPLPIEADDVVFTPSDGLVSTDVQSVILELKNLIDALTSVITPTITNIDNTDSPYTVLPTDTLLFVDTTGGDVVVELSLAADRDGAPLVIKDIAGQALTNNVTINPSGAEDIDGLASIDINVAYGAYRLHPVDGAGYTILP